MNFANRGLKICDSREVERKRRYLLNITATEKMDRATRQNITAAPNRPTFLSNSLKVMDSSFAPHQRAAPHSFWSAPPSCPPFPPLFPKTPPPPSIPPSP